MNKKKTNTKSKALILDDRITDELKKKPTQKKGEIKGAQPSHHTP